MIELDHRLQTGLLHPRAHFGPLCVWWSFCESMLVQRRPSRRGDQARTFDASFPWILAYHKAWKRNCHLQVSCDRQRSQLGNCRVIPRCDSHCRSCILSMMNLAGSQQLPTSDSYIRLYVQHPGYRCGAGLVKGSSFTSTPPKSQCKTTCRAMAWEFCSLAIDSGH